jgi:hypothetical protein
MPETRAKPAAGDSTKPAITGRSSVSASGGAMPSSVLSTAFTVEPPCPNTPSSEMIAMSAGNSDSTA